MAAKQNQIGMNPVQSTFSGLSAVDQFYLGKLGLHEDEQQSSSLFDKIASKVNDKSQLSFVIQAFYKNKGLVIKHCKEAKSQVKAGNIKAANGEFQIIQKLLTEMSF